MRIEHIALWSKDIDELKEFYTTFFGAHCNNKYINTKKSFESYFLSFDEGARIEIMQMPDVIPIENNNKNIVGIAHFALSVGSKEKVDLLTEKIRNGGYTIYSEPRTTGDGYYESVVLDPDNNKVEITI